MTKASASSPSPSSSVLVPTKTRDYLTEDAKIRGQHYACVSFVSPEDVIRDKHLFHVSKYLESAAGDLADLLRWMSRHDDPELRDKARGMRERHAHLWDANEMDASFRVFRQTRAEKLDAEFNEANRFRTSVRGLKIRGSYGTLDEARKRALELYRKDNSFNVLVMEVGCWCPWSPDPEDVKDAEFAETQLNTLVKNYHENQKDKDAVYNDRKQRLVREAGQGPSGDVRPPIMEIVRITDEDDDVGEGASLPAPAAP